jgi:DNA transformation protein and related proteins
MPVSDEYQNFVFDQLSGLTGIHHRRMFGGIGIYREGLFFALIENDTLRLKVDDSNRQDYELAGMQPFRPYENKKTVLQFYEVPVDVLEDQQELMVWAQKAIQVAVSRRKTS